MRILNALKIKPRRTIRIALWSGEEEGLFGSKGYAAQHFGSAPLSTAPDQLQLPEFQRKTVGPLALKPEQKLISAYFNVDNGTGKIRGIYTQGNSAVDGIFEQWMAPLRDLGVTTLTNRNTGGTDHLSFDAVGIPGFQFIQDPMDYDSAPTTPTWTPSNVCSPRTSSKSPPSKPSSSTTPPCAIK